MHVEIIVSFIEVMIIKTWRAVQIAVQVGTRRIKIIDRKSWEYLEGGLNRWSYKIQQLIATNLGYTNVSVTK
jgi:hypothetical protein